MTQQIHNGQATVGPLRVNMFPCLETNDLTSSTVSSEMRRHHVIINKLSLRWLNWPLTTKTETDKTHKEVWRPRTRGINPNTDHRWQTWRERSNKPKEGRQSPKSKGPRDKWQLQICLSVSYSTSMRQTALSVSMYFLSRCDWGFVQPHSICQPPGAEVQTAGGSDAGRRGGGNAARGRSCSSVFVSEAERLSVTVLGVIQDEVETSAERKNDLKSAPLENGLSPASGPVGHTPVATTPKASAANQQAATTGSVLSQKIAPVTKSKLILLVTTSSLHFRCSQTSSKDWRSGVKCFDRSVFIL